MREKWCEIAAFQHCERRGYTGARGAPAICREAIDGQA
jgi:hypothetical protein